MKNYFLQKNKSIKSRKASNTARGFTLVETLVAISIFTVSLLGMMTILSGSISNTFYAKQKIVASYLAQEGIEYIRNMRDTYVLYSADGQTGWNSFNDNLSTHSCMTENGCFLNADNLFSLPTPMPMTKVTLTACSSSTCPSGILSYDSTTGKYGFTGTVSTFTRKIVVNIVSSEETRISSTVSWAQGSGNYSIVFSESLFNWVE